MSPDDDVLYGPSAFRFLRIPPQVLLQCPPLPPIHGNIGKPTLLHHPVVTEILGTPIHILVTKRNDRRRASSVKTHLVQDPLPTGAIIDTPLGVRTCSPLFTLLTMARSVDALELAMVMYELCGNFAVFRPSPAIEELLASSSIEQQLLPSDRWRRVLSANGAPSDLWMRQPLIELSELTAYADQCAGMRGRRTFQKAARMVTGVASSPFEAQLSMLLGLPTSQGGKGFPHFTNNQEIILTARARKLHSSTRAYADLFFEGDLSHHSLDIECQSSLIHSGTDQALSDTNRATALTSMDIDVLGVTYDQISNIDSFHNLAALIARKIGYRLPKQTPDSQLRESELRRRILSDWSEIGADPRPKRMRGSNPKGTKHLK